MSNNSCAVITASLLEATPQSPACQPRLRCTPSRSVSHAVELPAQTAAAMAAQNPTGHKSCLEVQPRPSAHARRQTVQEAAAKRPVRCSSAHAEPLPRGYEALRREPCWPRGQSHCHEVPSSGQGPALEGPPSDPTAQAVPRALATCACRSFQLPPRSPYWPQRCLEVMPYDASLGH